MKGVDKLWKVWEHSKGFRKEWNSMEEAAMPWRYHMSVPHYPEKIIQVKIRSIPGTSRLVELDFWTSKDQ